MPDKSKRKTTNAISTAQGSAVQARNIRGGVQMYSTPQPVSIPRELPLSVKKFVARDEEFAEMNTFLDNVKNHPSPTTVYVVEGTAGVGKTAFVTRWAHSVLPEFPDGQLYVNLHGYGPRRAVPTAEVLAGFLRSLGMHNADIPLDPDERASKFRTLVADREMLIVLDNAGDEQVVPLLPGTSSCMVVVTSRKHLSDLADDTGAKTLSIVRFPPDTAVALLRELIGLKVDAEPDQAAALAKHCAYLPLALKIAAELANSDPDAPLADLVADLDNEESRLDMLATGNNEYAAVREVLSWSYQSLTSEATRTFRLLGLHPGRDFDLDSVAELIGTTPVLARRALKRLADANLMERTGDTRYVMHDLLRLYAEHLAKRELAVDVREAASGRLFDFFLGMALNAMDVVFPQERDRHPRPEDLVDPIHDLTVGNRAVTWLEAERANLLAIAAHLADRTTGRRYTSLLSSTLGRYLDSRGHFDDAFALHGYAVELCRKGDKEGDVQAQRDLGSALQRLGSTCQRLGRYEDALDHLTMGLNASLRAEDKSGQASALSDLGLVHSMIGKDLLALDCLRTAWELVELISDRIGQAKVLNIIGFAHTRAGRHEQALDHLLRAVELCRETADRPGEGFAVNDLGVVLQRLGRLDEARERHENALEIGTLTGDRSLRAAALNGLGNSIRLAGGMSELVLKHHETALSLAREIGDRYEEAQAQEGFASAYQGVGNGEKSISHWERAHEIYAGLRVPEASQVAKRMGALRG